jgi:hypothetical protein
MREANRRANALEESRRGDECLAEATLRAIGA